MLDKNNEKVFIVIESYTDIQLGDYHVVYHRDTKVMYVVTNPYKNGTFSLLVNSDGTPMLWNS